jgi:hypothetical protein
MTDLLLLLTMTLICAGIGLPLAELMPSVRFAWRRLLAPVLGFGVLSVIAPAAYRLGVSVAVIFAASCVVAGLSLVWRGPSLLRRLLQRSADGHTARVVAGAMIVATLILIGPRFVGGDQFAVFQGNQWDTYGYLESAVLFARSPYSLISTATDALALRNPLYDTGREMLLTRPSASLLYAVFTRVAPGEAYRLYYGYLVDCFALTILVALFVARNVVPKASTFEIILVALMFPLGFWGQYVLDINAWSQTAAAPLLLLMTALLVHSVVVTDERDSLMSGMRLALVIAVVVAGGLYFYPEGLLIHVAAVVPVALGVLTLKFWRARSISVAQVAPLAGLGGIATAVLYPPLLGFLSSQIHFVSGNMVVWWQFFDAFYRGRDGVAGGPIEHAIDFAAGLFGMYFATPGPRASAFIAAIMRTGIVITVVGLLAAVGFVAAGRVRPRGEPADPGTSRRLFLAWTAALLMLSMPALYFASNGNYWPAGKAVSYATPVFMLLLGLPLAYEFGHGWLRSLRWIVAAFVVFQAGLGVMRIGAAGRPNGIHYDQPYPAVQAQYLKTLIGWDFGDLERSVTPDMQVLIRRMDLWLDHRLMLFLWSRGIPFAREAEFVTLYGAGRNLGTLPATRWPDVEISASGRDLVLHFKDGRPDVRVTCWRSPYYRR